MLDCLTLFCGAWKCLLHGLLPMCVGRRLTGITQPGVMNVRYTLQCNAGTAADEDNADKERSVVMVMRRLLTILLI